jgi:hypothetical protein
LVLPAVEIVVAFGLVARSSSGARLRTMNTTVKGLRADIEDLDIDARGNDWRCLGAEEFGREVPVMDPSHEVMILAPYAEASVTIDRHNQAEQRRCSVCLN